MNDSIHTDVKHGPLEVVDAGAIGDHRTRAPSRTVVLMIEAASVKPTGD